MSTKNGPKSKGKAIQGKAAVKGKRVTKVAPIPEAVVNDAAGSDTDAPAADDTLVSAGTPVEDAAPIEQTPEAAPAAKRKRDMSIEDLRAEYVRVVGRETGSTDRRYLLWKLSEAAKGKITVGAIEKRAPRDKTTLQTLPLNLLRETTRLLDTAVAASGAKSRSAFIRAALVEKLRAIGDAEAVAAAEALAAEAG
jgi:hypothetical protein